MCNQAVRDGFKSEKNCDDCSHTRLMPANHLAWEIICAIDKGLISRFHSGKYIYWTINLEAIRFAFQMFGVREQTRQRELFDKISAYAKEIIEIEMQAHGQA